MDLDAIRNEIYYLEDAETSFANCMRLAALYTVEGRLGKRPEPKQLYSSSGSEFLQAASNAPIDGVLGVLDSHMELMRILYPKEYKIILNKIKGLV